MPSEKEEDRRRKLVAAFILLVALALLLQLMKNGQTNPIANVTANATAGITTYSDSPAIGIDTVREAYETAGVSNGARTTVSTSLNARENITAIGIVPSAIAPDGSSQTTATYSQAIENGFVNGNPAVYAATFSARPGATLELAVGVINGDAAGGVPAGWGGKARPIMIVAPGLLETTSSEGGYVPAAKDAGLVEALKAFARATAGEKAAFALGSLSSGILFDESKTIAEKAILLQGLADYAGNAKATLLLDNAGELIETINNGETGAATLDERFSQTMAYLAALAEAEETRMRHDTDEDTTTKAVAEINKAFNQGGTPLEKYNNAKSKAWEFKDKQEGISGNTPTPTPKNSEATAIPGVPTATPDPNYLFPQIPTEITFNVSEKNPINYTEFLVQPKADLGFMLSRISGIDENKFYSHEIPDDYRKKVNLTADIYDETILEDSGTVAFDTATANYSIKYLTLTEKTGDVRLVANVTHESLKPELDYYGIDLWGVDNSPTVRDAIDAIGKARQCNPFGAAYAAQEHAYDGTPNLGGIYCPIGRRKSIDFGYYAIYRRNGKQHYGADLFIPSGTPVYAAMDGKIIKRRDLGGTSYGKYIEITHGTDSSGRTISTLYAHLNSFAITAEGQEVKRGDLIAHSGATGFVYGSHLHFEVRVDNQRDAVVESALASCNTEKPTPTPEPTPYYNERQELVTPTPDYDEPIDLPETSSNTAGCADWGAYPPSSISDLRGRPSISVQTIQNALSKAGSPAASEQGFAQCLYNEGLKAGIDPAFPLAFFRMESSFGKAGIASHTKGIGNVKGIGTAGSYKGFRNYNTYCEAARDWYDLIKNGNFYFSKGKYTLETIIPTYAPSYDGNCPDCYINNVKGWVSQWRTQETNFAGVSNTIGNNAGSATGDAIVAEARKYIGILPYVRGGTSLTTGADCSGFTQSIHAKFGISIPRIAADQHASGTPVDKKDLQPGDLVFFDTKAERRVGHVGIYSGNCMMIDEPRPGKYAQEISFCHYPYEYLGARRYAAPNTLATTSE